MNKHVLLATLLILPLIVIFGTALFVYGWDGPTPGDAHADAAARISGAVYGLYAVGVLILVFFRK